MSQAQATYLEKLCREHGEDFDPTLSKRAAWSRIQALKMSDVPVN